MGREHILVVDDEESIRCLIFHALSAVNYEVTLVGTAEEALDVLSRPDPPDHKVDFLLTDFNLPGISGLKLIDELKYRGKDLPTIVMSGSSDDTLRAAVRERHCAGYLTKPFSLSLLTGEIRRCLGAADETSQNAAVAMEHCLI